MRGLNCPVPSGGRPRLHRVKSPLACLEVGDHTAPSAKPLFDLAAAFGMRVMAGRVGLPHLEHHVLDRTARAVDHQPLNPDAFARSVGPRDVPPKFGLVYIEPRRPRRQTDMHIWTRS